MLFDSNHIKFMIFTLCFTTISLLIFYKTIKNQKSKDLVLKIFSILTVIIHYSGLWVDYFSTGTAIADQTLLLPVYPCHIAMWLILIVAFMKNKNSKIFTILSEFTFYLGLVGGVIGIMFNENYAANPNMLDWDIFKGLLTHVTLLVSCIYLLVGKYIKIRVFNTISCIFGMTGLLVDGAIVILLHKIFGLDAPNAMFLLENPFPQVAWINTWFVGFIAVLLVFITTSIFEFITFNKEDRWYKNLNLQGDKK
ncbi:MAG: YwaF family protein [Clostridia bacterium]|nr:YwaF family protein [Clostridia bacterium]